MGTKRTIQRTNGLVIDDDWFNQIRAALCGDWVPRDAAGRVLDGAGEFGKAIKRFKRAFFAEGDWSLGDYKMHHSYNGAVSAGQGWMLCDGRTVTEANYDAEHGSGSWEMYCSDSPLVNKYLPNYTDRFIVGASETAQDGSVAITAVGLGGHVLDLEHNHKWLAITPVTLAAKTFDAAGAPVDFTTGFTKDGGYYSTITSTANRLTSADKYVSKTLSAAQSVKPESIELQIYMRIVE